MNHTITPSELLTHMEWVQRLARELVASPEQAQDLAQDTWVAALSRPPRQKGNLRKWLGAVLRNQARSAGRSQTSRAARERSVARNEAQGVVEQATIQHEVAEIVLALEDPYRTLLLLRYFQDLSIREIATKQGIALNTLRSQLVRAHFLVRDRLDRKYAGNGGRHAWAGLLLPGMQGSAAKAWLASPFLALAATGVLMLGSGAAWYFMGSARHRIGSSALDHNEQASLANAPMGLSNAPSSAGTVEHADADRSQTLRADIDSVPLAIPERGTLLLEVLDETTGAPIGELGWIIYEEGVGKRLLASGSTDTRGCARIEGLPIEDVLIVRTERRPPHAPSFGATWLSKGKTQRLIIQAGKGSSISGRMLDDIGTPLSGFHVVADTTASAGLSFLPESSSSSLGSLTTLGYVADDNSSAPLDRTDLIDKGFSTHRNPLAVSDAEGRWRVEHMASMPEGVWYVDNKPRPERWMPVKITACDPSWTRSRFRDLEFELGMDSNLDLGDITFLRNVRVSGRVLDALGEPVAGALVLSRDESIRLTRNDLPFPHNYNYQSGNLTDAQGRFEVRESANAFRSLLAVKEASGATTFVTLEQELSPGESIEDVEITLKEQSRLNLVLVGTNGSPIEKFDSKLLFKKSGILHVAFGMMDGRRIQKEFERLQDGTWTFLLDDELVSVANLEVDACGYFPRWTAFTSNGTGEQTLKLELAPRPYIKLHTVVENDPANPLQSAMLSLHLDSPEAEVLSTSSLRIGQDEMILFVNQPGTYWAKVRPFGPFGKAMLRGPLYTGQQSTRLRILAEEWIANFGKATPISQEVPKRKTMPPASGILPDNRPPDEPTRFTLLPLDRSTGRPLRTARILMQLVASDTAQSYRSSQHYAERDQLLILECLAGTYEIEVFAEGYHQAKIESQVHGASGERVDLGPIELDPLPELKAVLRFDRDVPLAYRRVMWGTEISKGESTIDSHGGFSFRGELGGKPPWLQLTNASNGELPVGFDYMPGESSPSEYVFAVIPKVRVTVDLTGMSQEEFFQPPQLVLYPGSKTDLEAYFGNATQLNLLSSPDGTLRRYRGYASPGNHTLELLGSQRVVRSISVQSTQIPQSFSIAMQ